MIDIVIEKHQLEDSPKKICPFCQSIILNGENIIKCPKCHIPHHRECWIEHGGCSIFGCNYKKGAETINPTRRERFSALPIVSSSPFSEDNIDISLFKENKRKKRIKLALLFLFAYTLTCIIFLISNWQADRSLEYIPPKSGSEEGYRNSDYEKEKEGKNKESSYTSPVEEYRELYKMRFGSYEDFSER
jgi:hypothetical protein